MSTTTGGAGVDAGCLYGPFGRDSIVGIGVGIAAAVCMGRSYGPFDSSVGIAVVVALVWRKWSVF